MLPKLLKSWSSVYRRLSHSSATLTVIMAAFAIALVLTLVTASSQNIASEEPASESSDVTLTVARTSDGTGADVSWTQYSGTNFYYYRFVVCSDANFSGSSCSDNDYNGTPYFNVETTGPINVTGLEKHTGYNVILQIWRHNVSSPIKVYATIAAVPTPTPTPTPTYTPTPTLIPTSTHTPTSTPSPTSTATPEKRSKYPKLEPFLHDLTDTYDSEVANRARENLSTNCAEVQCVGVFIFTIGDQSAIKRFIRDKKIEAPRFEDNFIFAYPPIRLLGSLSKQNGVRFVKQQFQLSFPGSRLWLDPRIDPSRSKAIQSPNISVHIPTTMPAKESNADKWHGADDWYKDGYKGKNVSVGIIDGGFEGFSKLQKWKQLPKSVQSMCHYEVDGKVDYEVREITDAYVSKCENGEKHGSAVTEAIYDIAPDVDIYVANIIDYDSLVRAVDWLVDTKKVKVINFSASTQFEGTGDGVSKTEEGLLEIIEGAQQRGVLWFNAAGNSGGGRMFHRDFVSLDKNAKKKAWEGGWMDFADASKNGVQIDSNQIELDFDNSYEFILRWEDDWDNPKTVLDLYLCRNMNCTNVINDSKKTLQEGFPVTRRVALIKTPTTGVPTYQTAYLRVRKIEGEIPD